MFGRNYQAELKFWRPACGFAVVFSLSACGSPPVPVQTGMPAALESRFYAPPGWTWGEVAAADGPALRYGVTGPAYPARAQVLILPDQAEPAEAWFETAQALIARRYIVWTLDWSGLGEDGGSLWRTRRGHVGPEDAAAALRVLTSEVIRPEQPLILLASGSAAETARIALGSPLPGVEAAILSSSRTPDSAVQVAHDAKRRRLVEVWARTDPLLKPDDGLNLPAEWMRWRERETARPPGRIELPITLLASGVDESCAALPRCRLVRLGRAREPLHLEPDAARNAWLAEVVRVVEERTEGRSLAAAPVR